MRIESIGGRRSGRSWSQLAALPEGGIYLVPTEKVASYCRNLLRRMGRDPATVRFATLDNYRRFMGAQSPAFVADHSIYDWRWPRRDEAVAFLRMTVSPYA